VPWSQPKVQSSSALRTGVPSPLAGEGQDRGNPAVTACDTPTFVLPRQGGGEEKSRRRAEVVTDARALP